MPETRPRRSGEILKTHRHKRRDHGSHRRIDMGTTARAGSRPALELAEKRLPSKRQLEIVLSKLKIQKHQHSDWNNTRSQRRPRPSYSTWPASNTTTSKDESSTSEQAPADWPSEHPSWAQHT